MGSGLRSLWYSPGHPATTEWLSASFAFGSFPKVFHNCGNHCGKGPKIAGSLLNLLFFPMFSEGETPAGPISIGSVHFDGVETLFLFCVFVAKASFLCEFFGCFV